MSKSKSSDALDIGIKVFPVMIMAGALILNGEQKRKVSKEEYDKKYHTCNVISVSDGVITVNCNQETSKLCQELDFKVVDQDEKELLINVYSPDFTERDTYTTYIQSKIYVDESGKVYFNESDVSEEEYKQYLLDASNNQLDNIQRSRKAQQRDN